MELEHEKPVSDWKRTRVTTKLGIEYPIIQGPLAGLMSQKLTAEVSNFGGLGSFGAHLLEPAAIRDVIHEIRTLTVKPFAVNLWVSMEDESALNSSEAAFRRSLEPLAAYIRALGAELPEYKLYSPRRFEDQMQVVLEEKPPVFSFIYGIPPGEILEECRRKGIVIVGSATTPDEARALEDAGVDVTVASGFEAGGHRGSFLRPAENSLMGTFSLVPQVADAVEVPVVAAGGIGDARGIVAALALGSEGVQMGTAFLTCAGSGASEPHLAALRSGMAGKTALTRGFTGRLARGIDNTLLEELNRPETEILPYPLQRALMRSLSGPAGRADRTDLLPLWAGQSANLMRCETATELLQRLTSDVSAIAGEVVRWTGGRKR